MEVDEFPEYCKPEEYDITHIFTELIYLADSAMPINNGRLGKPLIQKKSDELPLTHHRRIYNHVLPKKSQIANHRKKLRYNS